MKVVIVTCFESNEERVGFIAETFKKRNDEVDVITTSFYHKKKEQRKNYPEYLNNCIGLDTIPYEKNLSIKRLISHYKFAKDAFNVVEELNPDFIWVLAPCHSLIKQANNYKKKHSNVKIVVDMIDMWPESLPLSINKYIFPLNLWKDIRKNNLQCADKLVVECDLYKKILEQEYHKTISTLHWSRDSKSIKTKCNNKNLSLCYIGSINNIIDVDKICSIISNLKDNITLHIIGDGEARDKLISEAKKVCTVEFHGLVFDVGEKKKIIENCHAGLNIYRDNLYIGLTVKSIDYLQFGLPIINNIQGDTYQLVENYKVGFNIDSCFTAKEIIDMRKNNNHIYKVYDELFTKDVFVKECNNIIDGVMK